MTEITEVTLEDIERWQTQYEVFNSSLLQALGNAPKGLSEYQLLSHLRENKPPLMPKYAISDHLSLFRCHFWLFHLLYRLRDTLHQQQSAELYISPLVLQLLPYQEAKDSDSLVKPDPLRAYYLDLEHLTSTDASNVESLMQGTFQRIKAQPKEGEALEILGLTANATWDEIRSRYRYLAQQNHPDRGGDSERFQDIQTALEVLKQCHAH